VQDAIIYLDPGSSMNLQNQIRQKLVDRILNGAFPPGARLASSRKLAGQLEVARNTVVIAYQALEVVRPRYCRYCPLPVTQKKKP